MSVGVGRVRHALGDGATEEQARSVLELLRRSGLLDPETDRLRLVGVAEFAEMAGVTPGAICNYRDLPEPIARLKNGRIWDRRDVDRYLKERIENGFAPSPLRRLSKASAERELPEARQEGRVPPKSP